MGWKLFCGMKINCAAVVVINKHIAFPAIIGRHVYLRQPNVLPQCARASFVAAGLQLSTIYSFAIYLHRLLDPNSPLLIFEGYVTI